MTASAEVRIEPAAPADAGEIFTVQRAAYVSEAQIYGDPFIAPLVESLEQTAAMVSGDSLVLKACVGTRIVGAVRGRFQERTCVVGRLVVVPDRRRQGIGAALMRALHARAAARADTCLLFTGHLSDGNLRLYRRLGYAEIRRERVADHLTLVHMRRPLSPPGPGEAMGGPRSSTATSGGMP
jgi:GNAT superfamily N-acetyltransferase